MKRGSKIVRFCLKIITLILVGAFSLVLFFPGIFTKYLQTYANTKYLQPLGLRVDYSGFRGDLFGTIRFNEISIMAKDGTYGLKAFGAGLEIDFLRLLKRDLSFDEVIIDNLQIILPERDSSDQTSELSLEGLPWVSIQNFQIGNCEITQGEDVFNLTLSGKLDLTTTLSLHYSRIMLVHPKLNDTLRVNSDQLEYVGDRIKLANGIIRYNGNTISVDGEILLKPKISLDLLIDADIFNAPVGLPKVVTLSAAHGRLSGDLDTLRVDMTLGLEVEGHKLDSAWVDLNLGPSGIRRINTSRFVLGEQSISLSGVQDSNLTLMAQFNHFEPNAFVPDLPELKFNGSISYVGALPGDTLLTGAFGFDLDSLVIGEIMFNAFKGSLRLDTLNFTITDTLQIDIGGSRLNVWGQTDRQVENLDLELYFNTDSLAELLTVFNLPPVKSKAHGQLWVSGLTADPSVIGAVTLANTEYAGVSVGDGFFQFVIDSLNSNRIGQVLSSTSDMNMMGILAEGGEAEFLIQGDTVTVVSFMLYEGVETFNTHGYATLIDPITVHLDTIYASRNSEQMVSGIVRAQVIDNSFMIERAQFTLAGGTIQFMGEWMDRGDHELNFTTENVDLERFYRFLGLQGTTRGTMDANLQYRTILGKHELAGQLALIDGTYLTMPFDSLKVSLEIAHQRVNIENLEIHHESGILTVNGTLLHEPDPSHILGLGRLDSLDLIGNLQSYQLHNFQPILPWTMDTYGVMTGNFTLGGAANDPIYRFDLVAIHPQFDLVKGDQISGRIIYEDQRINFLNLALSTPTGSYTGGGYIPVDLDLPLALRPAPDEAVSMSFSGTTTHLDFLTPYFGAVDSLIGDFNLQLDLSGTHSHYIRDGIISVRNGRIELYDMENPIVDVNGRAEIVDNIFYIRGLTARTAHESNSGVLDKAQEIILGWIPGRKSDVSATSHLEVTGTMDMTSFFEPVLDIQMKGENLYFESPLNDIVAVGSADFTATGRDTITLAGEFVPNPGALVLSMDYASTPDYTVSNQDDGTLMMYNIHIPLHTGAIIRNNEIDAEIEGDITLTAVGSESFRYAGEVEVVSGSFVYNGYNFNLDEARITLDPSEFNPQFYIRATTQAQLVPTGGVEAELVDVTLVLTGYLDEPVLTFEAPEALAYTNSDFLQLFALGNAQPDNAAMLSSAGWSLGSVILREIEEETRRMVGLDRFQIQAGSALNLSNPGAGAIQIHMGKRITPRLFVGIQADPTLGWSRANYMIAYRLAKNMSLEGSLDNKGLFEINYRLKYRY